MKVKIEIMFEIHQQIFDVLLTMWLLVVTHVRQAKGIISIMLRKCDYEETNINWTHWSKTLGHPVSGKVEQRPSLSCLQSRDWSGCRVTSDVKLKKEHYFLNVVDDIGVYTYRIISWWCWTHSLSLFWMSPSLTESSSDVKRFWFMS
jgi:hypothetical protein